MVTVVLCFEEFNFLSICTDLAAASNLTSNNLTSSSQFTPRIISASTLLHLQNHTITSDYLMAS